MLLQVLHVSLQRVVSAKSLVRQVECANRQRICEQEYHQVGELQGLVPKVFVCPGISI